jgi:hypothetical protein
VVCWRYVDRITRAIPEASGHFLDLATCRSVLTNFYGDVLVGLVILRFVVLAVGAGLVKLTGDCRLWQC